MEIDQNDRFIKAAEFFIGLKKGHEKTAKLTMRDVEGELGFTLDKKHHPEARKEIDQRNERSFALRHPYLTGIPTLGIAPTLAKSRAKAIVTARLLRNDPGLRGHHEKVRERFRKREVEDEQLSIERAKAEAPVRAVGAAMAGLAPVAHHYTERRYPRNDR